MIKFRVVVTTIRLNPCVVKTELVDITVENTVLGNVIYSKINNYTDSIVELKAKVGIFSIDKETVDLFIRDANGVVSYTSEGKLPEEEEDSIFSLYEQAEIAYFK